MSETKQQIAERLADKIISSYPITTMGHFGTPYDDPNRLREVQAGNLRRKIVDAIFEAWGEQPRSIIETPFEQWWNEKAPPFHCHSNEHDVAKKAWEAAIAFAKEHG